MLASFEDHTGSEGAIAMPGQSSQAGYPGEDLSDFEFPLQAFARQHQHRLDQQLLLQAQVEKQRR